MCQDTLLRKFKREELQKAWHNKLLGAAALATGLSSYNIGEGAAQPNKPFESPKFSSQKLIQSDKLDIPLTQRAIAHVESNGGKNTNHQTIERGPDKGTKAHKTYGFSDSTIKETIKRSPSLHNNYKHVLDFDNQQMEQFFDKNPDFEHKLAQERIADMARRLKTNRPEHIAYGWLNGVSGAQKAIKEGADIDNHWHVKKVMGAYNAIKSKQLQRSFQEFFLENLCKNQLNSKISKDILESTKILSDSWKKARKKLQEDNCDELTKPQGIPEWKKDQEEMKNSYSDQLVSLIKSQSI